MYLSKVSLVDNTCNTTNRKFIHHQLVLGPTIKEFLILNIIKANFQKKLNSAASNKG